MRKDFSPGRSHVRRGLESIKIIPERADSLELPRMDQAARAPGLKSAVIVFRGVPGPEPGQPGKRLIGDGLIERIMPHVGCLNASGDIKAPYAVPDLLIMKTMSESRDLTPFT